MAPRGASTYPPPNSLARRAQAGRSPLPDLPLRGLLDGARLRLHGDLLGLGGGGGGGAGEGGAAALVVLDLFLACGPRAAFPVVGVDA